MLCLKWTLFSFTNFQGHEFVGSVSLRQIYEIAQVKGQDPGFKNTPLIGVCKTIIHSAHAMGIKIVNDKKELDELEKRNLNPQV